MGEPSAAANDDIDRYRDSWRAEAPRIDTVPMSIFGRIYRISHRIAPAIEAVFAKHGIDRGEFDVIATLRRSGPPYRLAPTDLYRSLMISSGGLTHRLGRLEKAGLVTRHASVTDRRSLLVQLTDKGLDVALRAFAEDMILEGTWLHSLSAGERADLAALLRKLLLNVPASPWDK